MGDIAVIGLTGGIGTGKSTVSSCLKKYGFAIIDADEIARQIVAPGEPLLAKLEEAFGSRIIKEDGTLHRKELAAVVFQNNSKKRLLDSIMHARIIEEIDRQIRDSMQKVYRGIIVDAPLLFETGIYKKCKRTWLMVADQDVRIARICERDGITPKEALQRIRSQMDDRKKRNMADVIIDNSGTKEQLRKELDRVLKKEECILS